MEQLKIWSAERDIILSLRQLEQFAAYESLLLSWNKRINLTAITEHNEVLVKHFLDSLLLSLAYPFHEGDSLLDVGTGAGFPAIPLKILYPWLQVTLLDSQKKRLTFLRVVSESLGQDNCCLHGRAEDLGGDNKYRERFSCVTARAVAGLPVLSEYCLPFVRVGGSFLAMKGPGAKKEVEEAECAVSVLGGKVVEVREFSLPGGNRRSVIRINKISQTPPKYPRNPSKIAKCPL